MVYIIQTISEPVLYVKEVIQTDEGYMPILTSDWELAMQFESETAAQAFIDQFVDPSNFIGSRPPHKPK